MTSSRELGPADTARPPAVDGELPLAATGHPTPPATWRHSAKAIVLDPTGRILLLHMSDPAEPASGSWWELPGGGVEAGETAEAAVIREVREETGLVLAPESVGPACWWRTATFRWMGRRHWQREQVHVVRLDAPARVGEPARTEDETAATLDMRWWPVEEVRASPSVSRVRFYPGRLPVVLAEVLAGGKVEEPFESWN